MYLLYYRWRNWHRGEDRLRVKKAALSYSFRSKYVLASV